MGKAKRGFTLIELLVVVAIIALLVSILLPSLGKAREQAKKAYCTNNLAQFARAIHVYAGEYKYFCPHNPRPGWKPGDLIVDGIDTGGFDPNIGWLMTYAMRMTPPETFMNEPNAADRCNHFKWYVLNEDELPDIVTCPAAKRELMFIVNPEIDTNNLESFVFQYAAFFQTSGTMRCGTPRAGKDSGQWIGGTNPVIPIPTPAFPRLEPPARTFRNACIASPPPYVWVYGKTPGNDNPGDTTGEANCWIQAVEPSQIDSPGRVYYMADTREYRPSSTPDDWPCGTCNDGWYNGWDNNVYMGTRHGGVPNVAYMDGHASSEGLGHPRKEWNMKYDAVTQTTGSSEWRSSSWMDNLEIANIGTQHHVMPQLMVEGWESILKSGR